MITSPSHNLIMSSPVGLLNIISSANAVTAIDYTEEGQSSHPNRLCQTVRDQLEEYFDNKRETFDLPLDPAGTDFQQKVWEALQDIPYGQTISYGTLSERINNKKAVRAVGSANGKNPIPIIIPCHRVIGSNGKLVGYSGGLWRKRELLRIEQYLLQEELNFHLKYY